MIEKLPRLTDDALRILKGNALRLERQGSPDQRVAAAALLPLIDAELARRAAAKPARSRKRAVRAAA